MSVIDTHEWVGRLAMALTLAKPSLPEPERKQADKTLDKFVKSDVCTDELRAILQQHRP